MHQVAIFGAGRIGTIHAKNVVAHENCNLVAISDPDQNAAIELALTSKAEVRDSTAIFNDRSIDVILIASTTHSHANLIKNAASTGKHIFCEKPIDLSPIKVKECIEQVNSAGVQLMTAFNRRYDPDFAALKRRIDAGEIGTIEMLTIISKDPKPPSLEYLKTSGGLFKDMTIHDFDMARFLIGEEPTAVFAMGSCLFDPDIDALSDIDTATVNLRCKSGIIVSIINSRRSAYGYDQRIEAHGSLGMLSVENHTDTNIVSSSASGITKGKPLPFFLERYKDAYRIEWNCFISALDGKKEAIPTALDGLASLLLAEAANLSLVRRQEVTIDSI